MVGVPLEYRFRGVGLTIVPVGRKLMCRFKGSYFILIGRGGGVGRGIPLQDLAMRVIFVTLWPPSSLQSLFF